MAGHAFELNNFLISIIVIVLSITLHEFGHAISADRLGDPTPRQDGRITLWPDRHFDPLGFIMILFTTLAGFGIGWGKPVLVTTRNFRNPRRDMIVVAAFGPLMNLLLALASGLLIRFFLNTGYWYQVNDLLQKFLLSLMIINLSLMFFNLIPVHPLDGSKILSGLLPVDLSVRYDRFVGMYGPLILILLCFSGSGVLGTIIAPAVQTSLALLLGLGSGR